MSQREVPATLPEGGARSNCSNREAVATYIAMSYQKYYDHLKEDFATGHQADLL